MVINNFLQYLANSIIFQFVKDQGCQKTGVPKTPPTHPHSLMTCVSFFYYIRKEWIKVTSLTELFGMMIIITITIAIIITEMLKINDA